jgi:diguanylate cyclase (GGDEF)-like protein
MRPTGGSGQRVGSRLFLRYALASLVPVLALGLALVRSDQRAGLERGLAQGRAQASVIEQMAIAPALGGHDLSRGVDSDELERLQRATDLAIFSGSVSRLRLRSFTGRVVFSDDGLMTSSLPSSATAFRAAVAGRSDVAIVDDDMAPGRLIRVLQPVVPSATGQAVGVLELYLPYGPIAATVERQLQTIYRQLAAGLGALYLVLGGISWSTTGRLRRHAAERERQALHDALTGLPNREGFRLHAQDCTERGDCGAVAVVDLDRFKEVNDTLGHQAGDRLLQVVALRLRGALRPQDTVARLGGDEFGIILPGVGTEAEAVEVLTRARQALSADLALDGVVMSVEASFGIAIFPDHGRGLDDLLQHADVAMYQGKRGTAGVVVYRPGRPRTNATQSLVVQSELRRALERDELVLHYQPILDLTTGRATALEGLLRWDHPERGRLAPADFLPVAEHSGLIEPLTAWVLDRALADHAAWSRLGLPWAVAVNVSARNLESENLVVDVLRRLAAHATPADQLLLEVTETAIASELDVAVAVLRQLAEAGVRVVLDDFGAGYSSLSNLRHIPVSEIKVDRAFVRGLTDNPQDRAIVRGVLELAHGLGCTVTAEGVEDDRTANALRAAGCDRAQGYHFARPAPWPELVDRFAPVPHRLTPFPSQSSRKAH